MENIEVTVYCTVYNHGKFLRDALEGFVSQKTNFRYKVIVHDDASTDNSAEIIREYEGKYPDIIKAIYQTENQYSKGVKIVDTHIIPCVEGEYIAICEGDDFWTDENKLQKQYDFMKENPEYSACVHSSDFVNAETKEIVRENILFSEETDLRVEDVILEYGEKVSTNSIFYRRELREGMPECFKNFGIGDYPLMMYLSMNGKVRYFPEKMSCYRVMSEGSWSSRVMADTKEALRKKIMVYKRICDKLDEVDEYSGYNYTKTIAEKKKRIEEGSIIWSEYRIYVKDKNYKKLAQKRYRKCLNEETMRFRLRVYAIAFLLELTRKEE